MKSRSRDGLATKGLFHLVHSHVEAGMFSHLRVQTDTGQQRMEVFNIFTNTVSLTHANLAAIFSVMW